MSDQRQHAIHPSSLHPTHPAHQPHAPAHAPSHGTLHAPHVVQPAGHHGNHGSHGHGAHLPHVAAPPMMKPHHVEEEPIELVDDPADDAHEQKKIRAYGPNASHRFESFTRAMNRTGTGATRVKSFHCKYSEQGLEYIDDQINRWLDEHPDIEVKFVTPTVMTFEGKFREPALVLNVWY